tara:strand:- start:943 stop:1074 length:132 start_codon:yes stop_codon:yes gene_type:complete
MDLSIYPHEKVESLILKFNHKGSSRPIQAIILDEISLGVCSGA